MKIINNENHKNLRSNRSFEKLPKWFQRAKTKNAIIFSTKKAFIWQDGTWIDGVWEGDKWFSGTWKTGRWKGGNWYGGFWDNGIWEKGKWYDGDWYEGTWHNGDWIYGSWHNGDWINGVWYNGAWIDGIWHTGEMFGGEWYNGTWCGGFRQHPLCIWNTTYSIIMKTIRIGCREKSIKEWDEWFSSEKEYETKRDTEEFENIYKSYLITKYALELENKKL